MPFEPMPLPFWTVPAWNPNVNEARAAGEYPTAEWANQLQGLHDATVTKVNEIGADVDGMSTSLGVLGDVHAPGSVIIAGADGVVKALPPGTLRQFLQPNSNVADGLEWVNGLPADPIIKGSILVWDGTKWATLSPNNANVVHDTLVYDPNGPTGVAFVSTGSVLDYQPLTLHGGNGWTPDSRGWYASRTSSNVSLSTPGETTALRILAPAGNATYHASGTTLLFATLPPYSRPASARPSISGIPMYTAGGGSAIPAVQVSTNGDVFVVVPAGGPWRIGPASSYASPTLVAVTNSANPSFTLTP